MPATKSRRRGTAELQVFVCDSSMALKLKMCVYIDKRWVRISYNKNFLLKDLIVSTKLPIFVGNMTKEVRHDKSCRFLIKVLGLASCVFLQNIRRFGWKTM